MADQQYGSSVVDDQFFEQVERVGVEVVGRFVEHQQVGRAREQACQQQAIALAAGQRAYRLACAIRRKQEVLQITQHMARLAVDGDGFAALADVLLHGFIFIERRAVLVKIGHLQIGADSEGAARRCELAQQQA